MGKILAVITMDKSKVAGGAPIFVTGSPEEQQQVAFKLEKIMDASAHDLQNGTLIIVKHG
ncbi:capping complex subunit for YIEGIA [Paenibacillus sp. S-38]|uniref:capping complex subunit for YIEGIA n=1 Tax=Paenibacillus sp. S-38 TaxID=3416710 RepID=UPI003CEFD4EB